MKKIYKNFASILVAFVMMIAMTPMVMNDAFAAKSSFVSVRTQIKDSSTSFGGGSVMISGDPISGIHNKYVSNGCRCEFSVGEEVKISAQAEEGYHFVEWQRGNSDEYGYGDFTVESYSPNIEYTFSALDDNYYLFAIFEKDPEEPFTVTFDSRGGSLIEPQQIVKGETATEPQRPTKEDDATASFAGWYSDGNLTQEYNFRTPVTSDITLYAKWIYGMSVGTYNKTKSETDHLCGQFWIYNKDYDFWDDYMGNCNFSRPEGEVMLRIIPANGYRFIGWYEGEYLGITDHSTQDMAPKDIDDPNTLLGTDKIYSFDLDKYTCVVPVFEEEPLINFVDIGNVWTVLDPINVVPFTGEINPNEEGLDSVIALKDEAWISGAGAVISKEGSGIPKVGETYAYTATVEAINGNRFDPDNNFRFVYGGSEIEGYTVSYNNENNIAYISGFIPDKTIHAIDIKSAQVSGIASKTYSGKAQTQNPTVKMDVNGTPVTLKSGTDYTLAYKNNTNAGTKATVTITGKGNFSGAISKTFTINKAANPLKVTGKIATVKFKALKKKAQTRAATKLMKFTGDLKDKKTYTISSAKKGSKSFKKYFKINKTTGKLTVKKGLKKGKYKIKVKVTASGNVNYKVSGAKTVTFTVRVK